MTASDEALTLARAAALAAADKKASDVRVLDVSDRLVITDCFVIASASNERLVSAVVDGIEEKLAAAGSKPVRREGQHENRWVLLDYEDVVVHVQQEDERLHYGLDRLWKDCPVVTVDGLDTTATQPPGAESGSGESGGRAHEVDHEGDAVRPGRVGMVR